MARHRARRPAKKAEDQVDDVQQSSNIANETLQVRWRIFKRRSKLRGRRRTVANREIQPMAPVFRPKSTTNNRPSDVNDLNRVLEQVQLAFRDVSIAETSQPASTIDSSKGTAYTHRYGTRSKTAQSANPDASDAVPQARNLQYSQWRTMLAHSSISAPIISSQQSVQPTTPNYPPKNYCQLQSIYAPSYDPHGSWIPSTDDSRRRSFHTTTTLVPPSTASSRRSDRKPPKLALLPIPIPKPDYMAKAANCPTRLTEPKQLLVVLDLNGVLVYRKKKQNFTVRPGLHIFLDYLFANHQVMVWSSGMPQNVIPVCEKVFTAEQHAKLFAVWARDQLRLGRHYNDHVCVYKNLDWVWEAVSLVKKNNGPARWDQTNTVLIDDDKDKGRAQPFNVIEVGSFEGYSEQMETDTMQGVQEYLDCLKHASDVSQSICAGPYKKTGHK